MALRAEKGSKKFPALRADIFQVRPPGGGVRGPKEGWLAKIGLAGWTLPGGWGQFQQKKKAWPWQTSLGLDHMEGGAEHTLHILTK